MVEEEVKSQGWFKIILGVLVTIYGITAAFVSHQGSQLDTDAREMTFVGIIELTKGNDAYAVADGTWAYDYDALTQIILLEANGGSETAIDIWWETLSEEAKAAIDRSGDLDDQYTEEVYAYANDLYANASLAYETAQTYSDIGNDYELVTLMLAMGLAFVGWASLLDRVRLLQYVFAVIAFLVLGFAIFLWLGTWSTPLPPAVVPLQ